MADTGDNLVCIEQLRAAHADLYRNRETQTDLLWERLWQTTNSEYGKFATRPECKTASCQGVTADAVNNNNNNNSFNGNTQYQQTSTDYGTGCVRFSDDVTYSDGQQTWQAADGCNTDYGNYTNYLNTENGGVEAGTGATTFPPVPYNEQAVQDALRRRQERERERTRDPFFNPAQEYVEKCCSRMWNSLHGVSGTS